MTRLIGGLLAAVLAVLLSLTGCTSSGGGASSEVDSATSAQEGSAAGTAPDQDEKDLTGASPDESLTVEAEPGAPLELNEEEQAFLVEVDAPADVYEGAVLEAGYEACLRIEQTASVDEDALRDALASGEISDGEAAIRTLCPEFEQYLPTR